MRNSVEVFFIAFVLKVGQVDKKERKDRISAGIYPIKNTRM